ncbi:GlxA family transcriptional regulator [Verminephrobacter eiseniae]|nr:helix-turn-helix domain-containing protein [Verminephrobacter eiseniae]MCW5261850.1 helix-turn-helix domain-containing protein [Verminephrobacter eiseniae]MCW5287011.1 helix-turn-helix domain-containing protein [Verminephrobacter eiseniae]MCW5305309.1 helix-turn-helix domain-containing protein [Verminephrobacter eiseniae]MCW8180747.1 helix-turn-helix domain-containing protein [Verminephrobacter eiseniae]MCW8189738.1 helix-turn-helix domain-containing protein [Verminephrobacter eiseniae]
MTDYLKSGLLLQANPANMATKTDGAKRILFAGYDGLTLLDLAGPMQAFEAANAIRRNAGKPPAYEIRLAASRSGRLQTDVGVPVEATSWQDDAADNPHLIVVPGGPGVWNLETITMVDAYLRSQRKATEIASVCIGAFLLGHAGLLTGKRVVTHWRYCQRLQAEFPDVRVDANPIFIHDENIWTSAGVTAGIDLALAIIERDHGHCLAADVARGLVVFLKRSGGQSQYSKLLETQSAAADGKLSDLHAWISDNLHRPLSVETLAEKTGMSLRSFARFYVDETGVTPRRAIENLRVDAAQRMLADYPKLSLKRIADKCGFTDDERMRRTFIRRFGVPPSELRQHFTSSAASR